MIDAELEAKILRMHHVEKWPVGTIADQLHVHHDVVRRVITSEGLPRARPQRPSRLDPYIPFILDTLRRYPRLPASRLYLMCQERGYCSGPDHFRHMVAQHRPRKTPEAFLRTTALPGEHGQVDWGHFGRIEIDGAQRGLMAFVIVLSYSRRIFLRFYLGQKAENFLRGHVAAFAAWGGQPRVLLYDNLKSAVLERRGDAMRLNPLLVEFASHYHFDIRPVAVARGNEKGRVERAIRYVRSSFWPARTWRDLDDLNEQADAWCNGPAMQRRWPDDDRRSVAEVFAEEQGRLLPLPDADFPTEESIEARVGKTPYLRFDLNDYSVPHKLVQSTLQVRATLDQVRVFSAGEVVAVHARSYGRRQRIEDPAHIAELRKAKGESRRHRAMDRLALSVPSSQKLFVELGTRGDNLGRMTQLVCRLLDEYGAARLEQVVREALDAGTLTHHALRQLLERNRVEAGRPPAVIPELPDKARDLAMPPRSLDSYDSLLGEPSAEASQ